VNVRVWIGSFFYEDCIWLGLGLLGGFFSCRRLLAGVYV
jgi:hypothetical protein